MCYLRVLRAGRRERYRSGCERGQVAGPYGVARWRLRMFDLGTGYLGRPQEFHQRYPDKEP